MRYEVEIVEKRIKRFIVEAPEMDDRKPISAASESADAEGAFDRLEVDFDYNIDVLSYDGPQPAMFSLGKNGEFVKP